MATLGKQKGNTFERKIATILSDRFSHLFDGKEAFRRNITSGSTFGGSNSKNIEKYIEDHHTDIGDIMTPKNFSFTIECKHYKTPVSINNLFSSADKKLNEWITQAELQAKLAKRDFLLIIKWNDVKEIVITNLEVAEAPNYHKYNGKYYIYRLDYFLTLDDTLFFSHPL